MSVQSNVANELTGRLAQTEYEKSSFNEKLDQFKAEYEEKLNQINGSYYVLRVAHNSLETRLKSSEQRREIAERELESQKNTTSQDQIIKENEELKDRVRCGAYEYTKLFEKLRLLKNQKFNNELNVYHGLNSQDDNKLTRRRSHITSTQNETQETCSQVDRASEPADSDNTLLDALLGSSFYNGTWREDTKNTETTSQNTPLTKQYTSQPTKNQAKIAPVATNVATIIQPVKSSQIQSSDMSDDGLMQLQKNKVRKVEENLSQKLNRCQIGGTQNNQAFKPKDSNCQDCGFVFPTGMKEDDLAYHMSSHHEQTCPVCFLQFDKGYSQQEFESHVDSHFSN
jgi:hypothetical protein